MGKVKRRKIFLNFAFFPYPSAGLASLTSRLECSLPAEDRNVSNSVLLAGEMKAEFVRILSHVQSFFSGFPRDLYH